MKASSYDDPVSERASRKEDLRAVRQLTNARVVCFFFSFVFQRLKANDSVGVNKLNQTSDADARTMARTLQLVAASSSSSMYIVEILFLWVRSLLKQASNKRQIVTRVQASTPRALSFSTSSSFSSTRPF